MYYVRKRGGGVCPRHKGKTWELLRFCALNFLELFWTVMIRTFIISVTRAGGGRGVSFVRNSFCQTLFRNSFLMTVDIEKAFNSINHCLLIKVLEKNGFEKDFIKWIKILLQNQESCIVNGGATTNYFQLEKDTRQGEPISAFLYSFCV